MSFQEEMMQQYDALQRWALKLTKNADNAQDLLQETICRALEKQHLYSPGSNMWGWLSKMQYNLFVTGYRRRKKFESQYDPEPVIAAQTIAAPQPVSLELNIILGKINRLSRAHRDALTDAMAGYSYAEIASRRGIPLGTARSRISRARKALGDASREIILSN